MGNSKTFLEQAIQEKNIRKIRNAIGSYIMADPLDRNGEIANAVRKVEAAGINIWQEHDGRDFEYDCTKWDKEYFTLLQSQLTLNFSKKRFEHMLEVGRKVYEAEQTIRSSDSFALKVKPTQSLKGKQDPLGKFLTAGTVVIAAAAAVLYYLIKK
ncbi:hypothetical protein HPJ93_00555 [Anoxybacillus flavithermus]|uniref:hypothetical protein n=1 Tax=Anoxybacillus flavithermus TaxID=33934 RepID=UPI001867C0F4|nr:hypothetical protein [Anoxybacillus flavithermus]MBE2920362.1 hypothetical protein [Anoxybacillus flavithermus]